MCSVNYSVRRLVQAWYINTEPDRGQKQATKVKVEAVVVCRPLNKDDTVVIHTMDLPVTGLHFKTLGTDVAYLDKTVAFFAHIERTSRHPGGKGSLYQHEGPHL